MIKINTKLKKYFPLIFIIFIGIFFSFYRLSDFYHFDYDQERDYEVVSSLLKGNPTLIGPRAVSSGGFYLGPWYYYFLVPFFFLFNGHPLYGAFLAGLANFASLILLYLLIKKEESDFAAVSISLFWLSVLHRIAWNVMFLPLFVIGILYFLLRSKQSSMTLISLIFLLSLGIHFHFQIILFYPLIFLYFLFSPTSLPKFTPSIFLSLLFVFLLPLLPLILFDFRHDFLNFNSFYNFFIQKLQGTSDLNYFSLLSFSFRNIIREIGLFTPWSLFIDYCLLPIFYLAVLLYLFVSKKMRLFLISLFPIISLFSLSLYSPPNWPEYYHLSASLVFLIIITLAVSHNKSFSKLFFVISLISLFSTFKILLFHPTDPLVYSKKEEAIIFILNTTKPQRPQIINEFPYGQGLGFTPIREYHQRGFSENYDLSRKFLLAYPENPKHNNSVKSFGGYAISTFQQ